MSTEIEFRHVAIRLERAGLEAIKNIARHIDWKFHYRLNDDHYMVFVEHGSNNTIDMRGRVARHWSLYAAGTAGDCMNVPIEYASGVHGGCTRFAKGRGTLPETYIAYYRRLIDRAIDFDSIRASGNMTFVLPPSWRAPESFCYSKPDSIQLGEHPLTHHEWVQSRVRLGKYCWNPTEHHVIDVPVHASIQSSALLWWIATAQSNNGSPLARLNFGTDVPLLDAIANQQRSIKTRYAA